MSEIVQRLLRCPGSVAKLLPMNTSFQPAPFQLFQPATTDCTANGLLRTRNAMRLRLWENDGFAHRWLTHPERECDDGCTGHNRPEDYNRRVALYESGLE